MNDYSKMSDQQINASVAKLFPERFSINDEGKPCELFPDHMAAFSGRDFYEVEFDPCNSWADAGPIILANRISLRNRYEGDWLACNEWGVSFNALHENPLRAAMIVFLMMKEHENDS